MTTIRYDRPPGANKKAQAAKAKAAEPSSEYDDEYDEEEEEEQEEAPPVVAAPSKPQHGYNTRAQANGQRGGGQN